MNYYNKFLSRPKSVLPPYTSRQYTVDRPDTNAVLNPEHNPVDCQSVTTDRQPNTLPLLGYRERIMVAHHKTIMACSPVLNDLVNMFSKKLLLNKVKKDMNCSKLNKEEEPPRP